MTSYKVCTDVNPVRLHRTDTQTPLIRTQNIYTGHIYQPFSR